MTMLSHDQIMAELIRQLDAKTVSGRQVASKLGIPPPRVTDMRQGKRRIQPAEMPVLAALLGMDEGRYRVEPDFPPMPNDLSYVSVEVLPTYAGMGGGGNGDGDRSTALIPRALIVDELRGKAEDFLLINVRGDSMEPDFRHGDQILIDKRDISPAQPGPFALWDGEWGEYVVKNVERLPEGRVRMFSSNAKYTPVEVVHDETKIIGRPVWFGRRL